MFVLGRNYNREFEIPKPAYPYAVGQQLHVHSHVPASPTTTSCSLKVDAARERVSVEVAERCVRNPPLPGSFGSDSALLEVIEPIRAGDGQAAQLLRVQVVWTSSPALNCPAGQALVAKIYDPLYYDHDQTYGNPFLCVDRAYTHECAAYARLESLQGNCIPKFYGSFSLSLPVDDGNNSSSRVREIRLTLMEKISGASMQDLDPSKFSQTQRQQIMKAVVDAETEVYNRDVDHHDIHPRNIIITDSTMSLSAPGESSLSKLQHTPSTFLSGEPNRTRHIVLVDFGRASTSRSPFPKWEDKFLPGVPISPLLRWAKPRSWFASWIDWDWEVWVQELYKDDRSSITPFMQKRWGGSNRWKNGP